MNIEKRVDKLEERFGVNKEPASIEEMLNKLNRGDYGEVTMMSIVVGLHNTKDLKKYFESLRQQLPISLAEWFEEQTERLNLWCKWCETKEECGEPEPEVDQRVFKGMLASIDGSSLGLPCERENKSS
jgi:hypothetical protein